HAVAGRGHGFRFKDWADFRSCEDQTNLGAVSDTDQVIGTGNGSATVFQLKKTYNTGVLERERIITKPIASTVVVSVDSSAIVSGWAVASATGVVTFDSAVASAAVVRAGFEFDVPCRFDTDELDVQWEHYELQTAQIPVSEIRT
ncbi:MAG: DUF2460 domain-containing protein, partial [Aestuariibacter sp.]|nr:DUF2460 domain-containing protein [Aestuariibacter sp.]